MAADSTRFADSGARCPPPSLTSPFGFTHVSGPVISYVPFDEFIASLRADGLSSDADRLHFMIHKVAWTTGSELIGELGQAMKDVAREHGESFSNGTRARMEAAFEMVNRVWPDFPR